MAHHNIPELTKSLADLYANQRYQEFIDQLLNAKTALSSEIYHYNLGTAYLKTGQTAAARYHLEKARQEAPLLPEVDKNLTTAINQLNVQSIEESRYFTDNVLQQTLRMPHELALTLTLLISIVLVALLRRKKIQRLAFTLGLAIALCPFALSLIVRRHYQQAILLESAFSHEGPSRSFEASSELPPGTCVIIKKTHQHWPRIVAPTHLAGWVERKKLGIL